MNQSVFTVPKLCKSKSGWYVWFRYNGTLKRFKKGLNYEKNLKKRESLGSDICRYYHQRLKDGWNPDGELRASSQMSIIPALNFALENKKDKLSPKTYLGYRATVKYISKAVRDLALVHLEITEIKRVHIRTIVSKAKNNRSWSNHAYNKNLGYLKAILTELVSWDIIEVNPAYNIDTLSTQESTLHTPPTEEEQKTIKKHLESNYPNFYLFVLTLFYTGIRPKEVLGIQLEMIDFEKNQITLPASITKTHKNRIVPINPYLMQVLLDLELSMYPTDFYLFGSYRTPGAGNVGKHIDFIPAPTRIKRDTATKRWKKIVKDELGIDVTMYSIKHYAANNLILNGVSLDAIRELFGHSSKLTTAIYAKSVKEVHRNEIMKGYREF